MYYVYLLQSKSKPEQRYIGYTTNLKLRLEAHNSGKSEHTAKYKPWNVISYHAFLDKHTAQRFELYLKTGSGQSFANRHFW